MHLPALMAYLQGLRENNNKAWFVMNKPAYDILRAEFTTLVADVLSRLAKSDARMEGVVAQKALFRIYRDIRFSHDKTPYKTRFSASMAEAGAKNSGPMYYMSIDATGNLHLGAGCYLPDRERLACLRRRVVDDFGRFSKLLRAKRFVATFGTLSAEDRLVRLPKGFDAETLGIERFGEYVRLKSFVVSTNVDLTAKSNATVVDALAEHIAKTFAAAVPLNDWLRAALRG